MKIIYLAALFFLISACSETDQEIVEIRNYFKQNALVINYTAASCYNCGAWGAPLVHDLEKSDDVIAICVHSLSDPMYTALMLSFKSQRKTGGEIPVFWVGDINPMDEQSTKVAVDIIKSIHSTAGLEILHILADTSITVNVKSTFSTASTSNFYLSVFLLEDGIDGSYSSGLYRQAGTLMSYPNDDYTHDFVLRLSATGSEAYGEKIVEHPKKGQVILKEYSFPIKAYKKQNVYPVAVLWKYDTSGSKPHYQYINAIK